MKKRFLIGILPALMVLSACAGVAPQKANVLLEDTLAHEEIFGGGEEFEPLKLNAPRKENENPTPAPLAMSSIGVQYRGLQNGTYAIRYVVAISDLDVTAVWTRDIGKPNGDRPKDGQTLKVTCDKAYRALSASGGVEIPSSLGDYKGFVVYTLRNIPEADVNSYLFAYLTISNENETVKSMGRITRLGGNNTFKINTDSMNGYFLQGNINGSSDPVMIDGTPSSGNYAQKEDLTFRANDSFGLFKYVPGNNEHFQFFGFEKCRRGLPFVSRVSENDYIKVPGAGSYKLYLNTSNEIHLVLPSAAQTSATVYLKPNNNWNTDSARFAVYAFEGTNPGVWYSMEEVKDANNNGTGVYCYSGINASTYPSCIFCRMNPATSDNNWDNAWNQTNDLVIDNVEGGNKYTVAEGAWSKGDGSWSAYIA